MKTQYFSLGLVLLTTISYPQKLRVEVILRPNLFTLSYRQFDPIEMDGISASDFYNQGKDLLKSQKYLEALSAYSRAVELDSDYYYAWWGQGYVLQKLNRHSEAMQRVAGLKPVVATASRSDRSLRSSDRH